MDESNKKIQEDIKNPRLEKIAAAESNSPTKNRAIDENNGSHEQSIMEKAAVESESSLEQQVIDGKLFTKVQIISKSQFESPVNEDDKSVETNKSEKKVVEEQSPTKTKTTKS